MILILYLLNVISYQGYNYNLIAEGDSISEKNSSYRFNNTFNVSYQLYYNYGLDEEECKIICNIYNDCKGFFINCYDKI